MVSSLHVLLIAEAANPEWTSVPLVGWSHSRAIARFAGAHLVTQIRNREAILRAGMPSGGFTVIDSEPVARWVHGVGQLLRGGAGKGWTTITALNSLSYYYFERLVWREFRKRLEAGEFDLVHRITPLSPTTPSLLAGKCARIGVPFVVGPLNGGIAWPRQFDSARRKEREWLSYVRGTHKLLPGYRSTRRCASALVVGSRATWEQIPPEYHWKCTYVPENAIDPDRFKMHVSGAVSTPLRIAFVGRLVPYKGADILLESAAPLIRGGKVSLEIIGDGPELPRIRESIARERIEDGVVLSGWIPHADLQSHLIRSDVFAFPSIREFGGAVVLEAMALGLVPVVVDYGGPGELVTKTTGYTVPIGHRSDIVKGFRAVLSQLAETPETVRSIGNLARKRVFTNFTWSAKARQMTEVYRWVLGMRAKKPDFGMPLPDV